MNLIYNDAMCREIEKARIYAGDIQADLETTTGPLLWWEENGFKLRGKNHIHTLTQLKDDNQYECTCDFYYDRHICSHIMTLERLGICPLASPESEVRNWAESRSPRLYLTPTANNNYPGGESQVGICYVY